MQAGWASVIGRLPDLKTLELVLETFAEKTNQLENVVECAKLWKFPIDDGAAYELVWDGQVESTRWSRANRGDVKDRMQSVLWYDACSDFEVRVVRFTRKRIVA